MMWETSNPGLCRTEVCAFIRCISISSCCLFWGWENQLSDHPPPSRCLPSTTRYPCSGLYLPVLLCFPLWDPRPYLLRFLFSPGTLQEKFQLLDCRNGYLHLNAMLRNYPKDWLFPSGILGALPGQWEVIWNHVHCRPMQTIAGRQMPISNRRLDATCLHLTLLTRISCWFSIN